MKNLTAFLKMIICIVICLANFSSLKLVNAQVTQEKNTPNPTEKNPHLDILNHLVIDQGKGTFTQKKYFKFLSEPIVSNGLFILNDNSALWQTQAPVFSQLLLTPKTIYTRLDMSKAYQPLLENSEFSQLLSSLIRGEFKKNDWQDGIVMESKCVNLIPVKTTLKKIFCTVQICVVDSQTRQINLMDPNKNKTEIIMYLTSLKVEQTDTLLLEPNYSKAMP